MVLEAEQKNLRLLCVNIMRSYDSNGDRGIMSIDISNNDQQFLRTFYEESLREDSSGWLACNEAERRSGISEDVSGRRPIRLANLGYLLQREQGKQEFAITALGAEVFRPWWKRHLYLIVTIVLAIIGFVIAVLKE